MSTYTKKIEIPSNKLEGLQNFVQLIINQIEAKEYQQALYTAVDLLCDLCSKANPYEEITNGNTSKLLAELKQQHMIEICNAITKGKKEGIREGRTIEKQALLKKLGLLD